MHWAGCQRTQMQLLQQQKYTLYYFSDCNAQNLNK